MKAQTLRLFRGYVESNSISSWILKHRKGFDSVEEALASIGQAFINAGKARKYLDKCYTCGHKLEGKPPKIEIAEEIEEYLQGTNDSTGYDTYEELGRLGWDTNPEHFSSRHMVDVDCAPQMIEGCITGEFEYQLEHMVHTRNQPIKVRKSEKNKNK